MFKTEINTNYNENNNIGHALVSKTENESITMADFIYTVDEYGGYHFYYENGTNLSAEDKAELEDWFAACGR